MSDTQNMQEEQKEMSKREKKKHIKFQNELKEYKDKYIRLLAEKENLHKRLQKEKQETLKFVMENTILEFLPLIDNFENALNCAKESSDEVKNWAIGFQMILTQFKDILHNYGIVAFHSKGNLYDPHYHEAMEMVETDEYEPGTIIEEFTKGYKTSTRTLRPAKVKVAKEIAIKEEEKINNNEEKQNEVKNNE